MGQKITYFYVILWVYFPNIYGKFTLKIPYSALIHFADPSVGFALQLQQPIENDSKTDLSDEKVPSTEEADERQKKQGDVIDIETFRKK